MDNATDILEIICRQAAQGNNEARTALYNRFSKRMFGICIRMTGSRQDAEDILQDSFVRAFRHINQLKHAGSFESWLRRIVINACILHARQAVRWQHITESIEEIPEEETHPWGDIPAELIQEEINVLPEGCREIFNLYAIENLSHQEVARLLGISVSTSKSQYHRARQLLKERLQPLL